MTDSLLKARLQAVTRRQWWLRLLLRLALCWGGAALAGLGLLLLQSVAGLGSPLTFPALALAGVVASLVVVLRHARAKPDLRSVAQVIERKHPELNGLLLTVVQQTPDEAGRFNFLQERLLRAALDHSLRHRWRKAVSAWRLAGAHTLQFAALAVFITVLLGLRAPAGSKAATQLKLAFTGVEVTPGDVSIERGDSLVVLARFGSPPKGAELIIGDGKSKEQRLPLTRSLADPVFGGSVPEIGSNFTYRVEYGVERTHDFKVTVFEHPKLERADADLAFPAYTGQPPKHVEDTRRISAVEGTRLDLALQLNKPVVSATLVPRGTNLPTLRLVVTTNRPAATLTNFALTASATYDLRLVDADGRTNKLPAQFAFDALPNRPPELKLASPRGDQRPSALEEISFTGTVWDDFGVPAFGLAFTQVGHDTQFVELGRDVPAKEKRPFQHLLRLEDLGVQPDQVVAWFAWADDIGPDGQIRRTTGDLFFAEVRPFDEIFREGEGQSGGEPQGGQQSGQGNPTTKLAELQKQIINATWKLQRGRAAKARKEAAPTGKGTAARRASGDANPVYDAAGAARSLAASRFQFMGQLAPSATRPPGKSSAPVSYEDDLAVIRESAEQAIEQARQTMERQQAPGAKTLWSAAISQMERSLAELDKAKSSPAALADALVAEQAAYQALLKLQARETSVTRSRNRNQGQGQGQQRNQQQLDELDLTQSENRYETQRQAQTPPNQERREQNQILNRLQELARRQQDVNERLKELQTSLQAANTEKERDEIRRQLKRLQDEQRQQLADADELQQRMSRPGNQSRMDEQRQQLERTRDELQRAAEATGEGEVAQALASGTRAQRQLQEMRDQLRKQSSSEFSEEMRDLRAEARELAHREEELAKQLAALDDPKKKTLSDSADRKAALDQLTQQAARMTNLVGRATQLSQQAETAEPLVSRQLYDTVRKFSQDNANSVKQLQEDLLHRGLLSRGLNERMQELSKQDGAKSLELTAEMLRQGLDSSAGQSERRARASIDTLRQGVEHATESVLGDDTAALQLAQQELDSLTRQLEREMTRATNGVAGNSPQSSASSAGPAQDGQRQAGTNRGEQPGRDGQQAEARSPLPNGPGRQPGQSSSPAAQNGAPAGGQGQSPRSAQRNQRGGGDQGGGQQPGSPQARQQASQGQRGQNGVQNAGNRGGFDLDRILGGQNGANGGGGDTAGPITGENFAPWADRLRDVEEMVDQPELRAGVAGAREQARLMRLEFRRDLKKPDWANVQLKVVKPLVEVRERIRDELSRRTTGDSLVPIDRDPVPNRYSELVRRYYEDLGKDPATAPRP